jgi:hypothetical protein
VNPNVTTIHHNLNCEPAANSCDMQMVLLQHSEEVADEHSEEVSSAVPSPARCALCCYWFADPPIPIAGFQGPSTMPLPPNLQHSLEVDEHSEVCDLTRVS